MNAMTKSKSGACGCGGGGGCGSGGDCGCGGKCGDQCAGGPLQRPLFFAGQLLTEDDLQLLSDYAAAKGRMHNRFLHGAGVVCGLQVGCHPCGGGKVIVHPGAALDCCGNDIYVPCAVELDINKMVAGLRLEKRGGHDCGDPCADDCRDAPDQVKCLDRKGRDYCLYVEYCEELEEPVTPYVSNGDCAVQVCKPTRLREGYKFVLRCPGDEPEPDSILTRIRCCIGDLASAEKSARDGLAAATYSRRYMEVAPLVKAGRIQPFTEADREQLRMAADGLVGLRSASRDGIPDALVERPVGERQVRRMLDRYQSIASAVIRYDLQSSEAKKKLTEEMPGVEDDVSGARAMVRSEGDALRTLSASHLTSARDRMTAEMWIAQGQQWTDSKLSGEQAASADKEFYANNVPVSLAQNRQFALDLAQLRDWLIARLDHKAMFSDCRLRRDVLAVQLPIDGGEDMGAIAKATLRLVELLLRYLIDCICAALNPPCQPCGDDAVKLACLTLEDCEVVRICNLERSFVLSGPAMRYWLPFLHTIGEFFEKACCRFDVRLPRYEAGKDPEVAIARSELSIRRTQTYMSTTSPAYALVEERPQFGALMEIAGIDQRQFGAAVNLIGGVGGLAKATSAVQDSGFDLDLLGLGRRVRSSLVNTMVRQPGVRETLVEPAEAEIAAVRRTLDEIHAGGARAAADIDRKFSTRMDEERKALEKRLYDTELAADRAARELRAALQDQGKQATAGLRDLGKSLEKRVANEEASAQRLKDMQVVLREQKKLNDALERRLAKLEAGG